MLWKRNAWLFVHSPHCAGNSITRALHTFATRGGWEGDNLTKHATARELRSTLLAETWSSTRTFGTVRNPWAWYHSHYHYSRFMARTWPSPPSPELREVWQHWQNSLAASFAEFLQWQTSRGRIPLDWLTDAGELVVERVIRVEDLAVEWPKLLDWLSLPSSVELPTVNQTLMNDGTLRGDYRLDYSRTLRDLVGRRASAMVERFGYAFDDPDSEARDA